MGLLPGLREGLDHGSGGGVVGAEPELSRGSLRGSNCLCSCPSGPPVALGSGNHRTFVLAEGGPSLGRNRISDRRSSRAVAAHRCGNHCGGHRAWLCAPTSDLCRLSPGGPRAGLGSRYPQVSLVVGRFWRPLVGALGSPVRRSRFWSERRSCDLVADGPRVAFCGSHFQSWSGGGGHPQRVDHSGTDQWRLIAGPSSCLTGYRKTSGGDQFCRSLFSRSGDCGGLSRAFFGISGCRAPVYLAWNGGQCADAGNPGRCRRGAG